MTACFNSLRFGVLPEAGGLRDQVAGELERMALAYDYYSAQLLYKRECKPGREDEFMANHPAAWLLVREVMDMRNERDRNG